MGLDPRTLLIALCMVVIGQAALIHNLSDQLKKYSAQLERTCRIRQGVDIHLFPCVVLDLKYANLKTGTYDEL